MQRFMLIPAILAALTGGASAADLIHDTPAETIAAPSHLFDWTGFYVGAHIGRGSSTTDLFIPTFGLGGEQEGDGRFAGAQFGYNRQIGNVVIGVQTDFTWSDVEAEEAGGGEADTIHWFGTTTAKLGYAVDRLLIYGKAGVSYGRASGYNGPLDDEVTQTHVGWTAGAGAEFAIAHRITVFAEYNHLDLGEQDYVFPTLPGLVEADTTLQTFKGGVNVRF